MKQGKTMTGKEFLNSLANGKSDILQLLLGILAQTRSRYCIIGGLAVNAYVDPVVSLDVDIVVAVHDVQIVTNAAKDGGFRVEPFEHSVNLSSPGSDLRIQVQTDPRYQEFIARAVQRDVLGYKMKVAQLEDVLQGKVWAYMDKTRRRSKRQKDLADILRIMEAFPDLATTLPASLKEKLDKE
jgi:hypothetical protein